MKSEPMDELSAATVAANRLPPPRDEQGNLTLRPRRQPHVTFQVVHRRDEQSVPEQRATPLPVRRRIVVDLMAFGEDASGFDSTLLVFAYDDSRHLAFQPGALFELRERPLTPDLLATERLFDASGGTDTKDPPL